MTYFFSKTLRYIFCLFLIGAASCAGPENLVRNLAEFEKAVAKAKAGDRIVLASGVWKDAELIFTGKGTAERPIVLTVEEKGKFFLEGKSNLQMAGEHLVVEGLVFRNGYTPGEEVISFRKNKENLSNNCRITECVIDNYSNPERFESDYWVGIYGKNNRFDHNYLVGKSNTGVTVAVRLDTEESRENNHRIDHNYFGYRPVLGSNGGETLRIGTSHYSLTNSKTLVENNYFDRCNGEHEIISNKSCQNVFRGNTFYECQGTLTMRHGNETLVEGNYFFGNGKANTGGIRIINERQKVINNYCEGLTGYRFRGALVIMNGVPNSPPNRYSPVIESEASDNTFVNCDYIQFCAGSDAERSAVPQSTTVARNLFYNDKKDSIFTAYDDISGITFKDNFAGKNISLLDSQGFTKQQLQFERDTNGLLMPTEKIGAGLTKISERATPENTGVSWYPKVSEEVGFNTGKAIRVPAGENTLFEAVNQAQSGDILELEAGDFLLGKTVEIHKTLTVRAADENNKPTIRFSKTSLFAIENGGSLSLKNLIIDGAECPDAAGNSVIRTSRYSMSKNYKLFIEDCDFNNLIVNHSFDVLKTYKSTFADSLVLRNSRFKNISGTVLNAAAENEDLGIYNAENVVVEKCEFTEIGGAAVYLYRGGNDESTFGPMFILSDSFFKNTGKDKRNKGGGSVALDGVQTAYISDCRFDGSAGVQLRLAAGEPVIRFKNCQFKDTPKINSNSWAFESENVSYR